jgi:electron transport complex protein RnfC
MNPNLLDDRQELYNFDGGLHLTAYKSMSCTQSITQLDAADTLVIPLHQHIGEVGELKVKVGDRVLKGQLLARPKHLISAAVHASVSGTVTHIESRAVPHPSGLAETCVVIANDHQHEWVERKPVADEYQNMNSHDLRNIIRDAGIVGLGGAVFPSAVKQTEINIQTLIINGVECEPYITCDDMLMRERASEILTGADIIGQIIKARECIIAIEDNKPEAIAAMQQVVDEDGTDFFRVQAVPTIYPSGGEKQIIKIITGKEVPVNGLPAEIDVLCHNVGTAYAIYRAVYADEPLISRVVTVTGHGVEQPRNIEVLLGTAMSACIEQAGGYKQNADQLIMGGPMMGFSLASDELPIVKATNCLLVTTQGETHPAGQSQHSPCIRCGLCVDVCPARLLPQQLYWYASSQNIDRLVEHDLFDCIECGCCSYVCPSNIPLVQYYRFAKSEIWEQDNDRKKSDIARRRHEFREQRLLRQKQEREERLRKKREALKQKQTDDKIIDSKAVDNKQDAIAAALARVQAKKQKQAAAPKNIDNLSQEQAELIAAVDKRREQMNQQASGKPPENQP